MANYLLLRNNKESGPYSLDDLMELGLKPYDLIWVQGKSAAWRYPSEVEELKPIAPAVEEQPFDRFLKKTDETKELTAIAEGSIPQEVPAIKTEHEKYIPKKSVYVTMPGQKNTPAKEPIKETLPPTPPQPTISISENPAAAQIKYSQPLDEIKEMYVKTLHDRKQKIRRKSFWLQNLKRTAALLSLVSVGLIAGYFIRSGKGGHKDLALQASAADPQTIKTQVIVPTKDSIKPDNSTAAQPLTQPGSPSEEMQALNQPKDVFSNKFHSKDKTGEPGQPDEKKADTKKQLLTSPSENTLNNGQALVPPQGVEMDASTGARNKKQRSGNESTGLGASEKTAEKRPVAPQELYGLVSVKSNEYKKVAFGGIRDLQLTVTNDSKYILENVTVELQYIKPNELPLKTENIQFTSIGPNSTSTIRVPDTNRGIKVVFRIVNIRKRPGDERVAEN